MLLLPADVVTVLLHTARSAMPTCVCAVADSWPPHRHIPGCACQVSAAARHCIKPEAQQPQLGTWVWSSIGDRQGGAPSTDSSSFPEIPRMLCIPPSSGLICCPLELQAPSTSDHRTCMARTESFSAGYGKWASYSAPFPTAPLEWTTWFGQQMRQASINCSTALSSGTSLSAPHQSQSGVPGSGKHLPLWTGYMAVACSSGCQHTPSGCWRQSLRWPLTSHRRHWHGAQVPAAAWRTRSAA